MHLSTCRCGVMLYTLMHIMCSERRINNFFQHGKMHFKGKRNIICKQFMYHQILCITHVLIQYATIFWNVFIFFNSGYYTSWMCLTSKILLKSIFSQGHTLNESVSFFEYKKKMFKILKAMLFDETNNEFVNSYKHKRRS